MQKRISLIFIALILVAVALCVVIASCNDGFVLDIGDFGEDADSDDDAPVIKAIQGSLDAPGAGADIQTPITYTGTVIDPRDDEAVVDALAQVTFADGTDAGYSIIYSDEDGKIEFVGDMDFDYKITVEKAHYINTEIWTTRSVCGDLVGTLPTIWLIPQPVVVEGAIAGVISDAFNPLIKIGGADVEFRAGLNAPDDGPVLFSSTTNTPLGKYELNTIDAGVYTGFISKLGSSYVPTTLLAYVLGGRTINGQHGIMTTELQQHQMRIVVTWGAAPTDLDSHLWAPCPFPDGDCENGYFHLYYMTNGAGSNPFVSYFDLDVDDVTSFGPETTTVYNALETPNETYSFLMHDYSNGSCTMNCFAMCNSPGHKVDVYAGECVQTFYPTPGTDATVWHVFDAAFDGSGWAVIPIDDYCHDIASDVGPTCN